MKKNNNNNKILIGNIVNEYNKMKLQNTSNSKVNVEFEIRYKLEAIKVNNLIKSLSDVSDKVTYQFSTNLIRKKDKLFEITTQTHKSRTEKTLTYVAKTQHKNIGENPKFSICSEKSLTPLSYLKSETILYRVKNRISFKISKFNCVCDITCTRQSNESSKIKSLLDHSFDTKININTSDTTSVNTSDILASDTFFKYLGNYENEELIKNYCSMLLNEEELIEVEFEFGSNVKLEEVENVLNFINKNNYNSNETKAKIMEFANIFGKNVKQTIKELIPQVLCLNRLNYSKVYESLNDYYITEKNDGIRSIIMINENSIIVLNNELIKYEINKISDIEVSGYTLIADCEYILKNSKDSNVSTIEIYIIDVLLFRSILEDVSFKQRLAVMYSQQFSDFFNKIVLIDNKHSIEFIIKKHIPITYDNLEKNVNEIKLKENCDGIIFTNINASYFETLAYKWKPLDKNTIDFYAMKMYKDNPNVRGYYILFVGIRKTYLERIGIKFFNIYPLYFTVEEIGNNVYIPIQFTCSYFPNSWIYYHDNDIEIDKKIIELGINYEINNKTNEIEIKFLEDVKFDKEVVTKKNIRILDWKFHCVRKDRNIINNKYYGNDYVVADNIISNYVSKFEVDDLVNYNPGYFANEKDNIYSYNTKANRVVTEKLISKLEDCELVIDVASGKGQDLGRYLRYKIRKVVFSDIDANGLIEIQNRMHQLTLKNERDGNGNENSSNRNSRSIIKYGTQIRLLKIDYTSGSKTILEKYINILQLNESTVDAFVCMFAFHYFMKNGIYKELLIIFHKFLKIGGTFTITAYDGKTVYDLLKKHEGEYRVNIGQKLKYNINALYDIKDEFKEEGQEISVLLPFNTSERVIECLLNKETLVNFAVSIGFKLKETGSFSDFFSNIPQDINNKLSENDKEYIALHHYIVLEKI